MCMYQCAHPRFVNFWVLGLDGTLKVMTGHSKHGQERAYHSAKGMRAAPPTDVSEKTKYIFKRAVQTMVFTKKSSPDPGNCLSLKAGCKTKKNAI